MGILDKILGRNKFDLELVERLKDKIDDFILDIRTKERMAKHRIKRAIEQNRQAPPALLMQWKMSRTLLLSLENTSATLDTAITMRTFMEGVAEILGTKEMAKVGEMMGKIATEMRTMSAGVSEMIKMSKGIVTGLTRFTEKTGIQMEELSAIAMDASESDYSEITREIVGEISADDPEFVRSLPKETLRDLGIEKQKGS